MIFCVTYLTWDHHWNHQKLARCHDIKGLAFKTFLIISSLLFHSKCSFPVNSNLTKLENRFSILIIIAGVPVCSETSLSFSLTLTHTFILHSLRIKPSDLSAELEITVGHRTLSDQISRMSGQFHIMIGHDDRTSRQHILSYLLQGVVSQ